MSSESSFPLHASERTADDIVERLWEANSDFYAHERKAIVLEAAAEIARLRADYQETIEKLQAVCEEQGCEAGLNRFDFLRSEFSRLRADNERLTAALKEYLRDYGENEDSDSQRMTAKARAALAADGKVT